MPTRFLVGTDRSGTTLLRMYLDALPTVSVPAESRFVVGLLRKVAEGAGPETLAQTIVTNRRFADWHLDTEAVAVAIASVPPGPDAGPRLLDALFTEEIALIDPAASAWVDKTPQYILHLAELHAHLPEARTVGITRDPRDVYLSLAKVAWRGRTPFRIGRYIRDALTSLAAAHDANPRGVLLLRYEDLVTDPHTTVALACEHLRLDFDPVCLTFFEASTNRITDWERSSGIHDKLARPSQPSDLERWRTSGDTAALADLEATVGANLFSRFGYEPQSSPSTTRVARAAASHVVQSAAEAARLARQDPGGLLQRLRVRGRGAEGPLQ